MLSLTYKILLRKKSTAAAILALALLVAIISSMYSIVNFINTQTTAVGQLRNVGNQYLVLNKSAKSLSDSQLNWVPINILKNCTDVKSIYPQQVLEGTLQTTTGKRPVFVRGVENLSAYLKAKPSYVNGTVAANPSEANMGVLLAKGCQVNLREHVNVSVGSAVLDLKIVGFVRSQGQVDNEVLVSLETANALASNGDVSLIEFSFKDNINQQEALANLSVLLPADVEVVKVQQTAAFLQQANGEILNFLSVWSLTVYFVVAAASYVVSTRLTVESECELVILKAIGVKRRRVFGLFFSYTVLLALVGAFLGLAFGVVGTQVSSTVLKWFWQDVLVEPFLEPVQVGQILILSIVFSAVGCVYPAFKSTQRNL